jgi:hypothetical protein
MKTKTQFQERGIHAASTALCLYALKRSETRAPFLLVLALLYSALRTPHSALIL